MSAYQGRTLLDIQEAEMSRASADKYAFHSPFSTTVLESIVIEPDENDIKTFLEIGNLAAQAAQEHSLAGSIASRVLGQEADETNRAELLREIGHTEFTVSAENPELFNF